jgi:hypothetical protein
VNKISKTPEITRDTKILSFDLEANNLHGTPFAIGAVILDGHDTVHGSFTARCPITGEMDPWVKVNVLPSIKSMAETHGSYEDMREAFWRWYVSVEQTVDYILVSNGYPVEYRFLIDCQEANLEERYWQHPFPILDLTSILVAKGQDSEGYISQVRKKVRKDEHFASHHPFDDAKLAALMAFEAFGLRTQ